MFTSEVIYVLHVLHVMFPATIMEDPGELLILQVEKKTAALHENRPAIQRQERSSSTSW